MLGILATLFIDSVKAIGNVKSATEMFIDHQMDDYYNPYVTRSMDYTYRYKATGEKVVIKHMYGRPFYETIPKTRRSNVKRYDPIGDQWRKEDEEKRQFQKRNLKPGQIAVFYRRADPTGINILFEDANSYDFKNENALKLISNEGLMYGNIYEHIQSGALLWARNLEVKCDDMFGNRGVNYVAVYINSKGKIIDVCDFEHDRLNRNPKLKKAVLSSIESYNEYCSTRLCNKSHVSMIGNIYDKEEFEKKREEKRIWYNS